MVTYKSVVMKVRTPDGTVFVNVMENEDGKPFQVIVNIGKAGSAVAAWAQALGSMISIALQTEDEKAFDKIITELSSITSSGTARSITSRCTSGPEGVWMALIRYRRAKFIELESSLGSLLDEDDEDAPLTASVRRH